MSAYKRTPSLQKKRTPAPSHSTRALSTAMSAAAFVAEYRQREGAAMVAATDERWCRAGDVEDDARTGRKAASARAVPTKLISAHARASAATASRPEAEGREDGAVAGVRSLTSLAARETRRGRADLSFASGTNSTPASWSNVRVLGTPACMCSVSRPPHAVVSYLLPIGKLTFHNLLADTNKIGRVRDVRRDDEDAVGIKTQGDALSLHLLKDFCAASDQASGGVSFTYPPICLLHLCPALGVCQCEVFADAR